MKCPTCKDAEENKCCHCKAEIPEADRKLETDPFAEEINGSLDLHLQCSHCQSESANDI
jgi:hypothetical protein